MCNEDQLSTIRQQIAKPGRACFKPIQAKEQSKDSPSLVRQSNLPQPSAPLGPSLALALRSSALLGPSLALPRSSAPLWLWRRTLTLTTAFSLALDSFLSRSTLRSCLPMVLIAHHLR